MAETNTEPSTHTALDRDHTALDRDPTGAQRTVLLASAGFFLITLDILIVNVALTQMRFITFVGRLSF